MYIISNFELYTNLAHSLFFSFCPSCFSTLAFASHLCLVLQKNLSIKFVTNLFCRYSDKYMVYNMCITISTLCVFCVVFCLQDV